MDATRPECSDAAAMTVRRIAAIAALIATAGACSSSKASPPSSNPPVTTATAAPSAAAWTSYGHDLANSRLNPLETAINPTTTAKLRVAWSTKGEVGVTGTPIVASGVLYYDDWAGTVHADNATTGKAVWATNVGGNFIASPALSADG